MRAGWRDAERHREPHLDKTDNEVGNGAAKDPRDNQARISYTGTRETPERPYSRTNVARPGTRVPFFVNVFSSSSAIYAKRTSPAVRSPHRVPGIRIETSTTSARSDFHGAQ